MPKSKLSVISYQLSESHKGFTLIELMVAMTIVAILATIGLTIYSNSQKYARDAKRKEDLSAIAKALEQVKTATGAYPTGCNNKLSNNDAWTVTGCNLANFMQNMPKDPQNSAPTGVSCGANTTTDNGCHVYKYCSDGIYYTLGVNTEATPDQGDPPNNCELGGRNRIFVTNQL